MIKALYTEKALPENRKSVTFILSAFAVIYVLIMYCLGFYLGFYKSPIKFSISTLTNFILPLTFLIFITEYVRNKILNKKIKYKKTFALILLVIIDVLVNIKFKKYNITNKTDFLAIIGYILFVSIANNILFNYIAIRYGIAPNIIYRLITQIYMYIIPYTPNVHILINTFIKLIMPYIIYIVLEYSFSKQNVYIPKKTKQKNTIISTILIMVMILIIMLVTCNFKYGILVIGSESMTGVINKGDAIIYEQRKDQKIKNNDIIVFKKEDTLIIHRVVEIRNVDNEKRYYTKGDANLEKDKGYVTDKQIVGIYKFKINKIGNLTLLFNNIFKK